MVNTAKKNAPKNQKNVMVSGARSLSTYFPQTYETAVKKAVDIINK